MSLSSPHFRPTSIMSTCDMLSCHWIWLSVALPLGIALLRRDSFLVACSATLRRQCVLRTLRLSVRPLVHPSNCNYWIGECVCVWGGCERTGCTPLPTHPRRYCYPVLFVFSDFALFSMATKWNVITENTRGVLPMEANSLGLNYSRWLWIIHLINMIACFNLSVIKWSVIINEEHASCSPVLEADFGFYMKTLIPLIGVWQ